MSRTTRRLPLVGIERQRVGWQKSNPKKSWRLQVGRASRWSAPSIGGRAGNKNSPERVGVWERGAPPVGRPSISGRAGKKTPQNGLAFGSGARLPLVGPTGGSAENHSKKGWCLGMRRASRRSAPSINGRVGRKPFQEGLVFGGAARLPLVGPEHQQAGRQSSKAITNTHTHRKEHTRTEHRVVGGSFSGSLTIGNDSRFQAHSVLE